MLPKQKSSGIKTEVQNAKQWANFQYQKEIQKSAKRLASGLVQQLSLPVSAAAVDLRPLVEAGSGRGEHDEELLFEA